MAVTTASAPLRRRRRINAASQAQILVTTSSGSTCGTFVSSAAGSLDLAVDGSRVRVPLNRLVTIQAVTSC